MRGQRLAQFGQLVCGFKQGGQPARTLQGHHPVERGVMLGAGALVTWSPWHGSQRQALEHRYRAEGRPVIVMENGWLSPVSQVPYWQVARDGWNGTGTFPDGGPARWRSWGLSELPWVQRTGYALICGQRGHPSDARTALPGWHERLQAGQLPVVRRPRDATRPLLADMQGAAEVHVWTSNAASVAIMLGIPVVQHGPNLMVSALASRPGAPLYRGDRGAGDCVGKPIRDCGKRLSEK